MGVRFPGVGNNTQVTATVTLNTETVVAISTPLNIALAFQQIVILWYIAVLTGSGNTTVTVRIRRGSTVAGQLVNASVSQSIASLTTFAFEGSYVDTPGDVAGQQYCVTYQGASAGGNANVLDQSIILLAL